MDCPRVLCNVPVYTAVTPIPFINFMVFSQETGKAETAGKYKVKWNVGGPQTNVSMIRNIACKIAIEGGATHLFLVDDDMLLPSGILEYLLGLDKPIVSPVFFRDDGDPLVFEWANGMRVPMVNYPIDKLFEAPAGTGTGIMLIKTEVLKSMESPWFDTGYQLDLEFCHRAEEKGFKTYCDSRVMVQQMGKPEPVGKKQWDERKAKWPAIK
jgi:hypothetical protein